MVTVVGLTACSPGARIEGTITDVEGHGGRVSAITVRTAGGPQRILIDPGRNYGFDLAHLKVHQTEKLPVKVKVKDRGGNKVALDIDDA